jgi:hypothetical protein
MITNEDMIEQLKQIHDLALRDYPYPENSLDGELNGNLLLALGQIAGLASKAIAEYK